MIRPKKWLPGLDNCKNLSDSFQYKSKSLKTKPSSKVKKKSPPGPHPLHIAKEFQNQLEASSVNKADLARRHGISRARITQITNLLNLESGIKEEILNMPQSEQRYFTERKLRKIAGISSSKKQLQAFDRLKSGIKNNGAKEVCDEKNRHLQ
ncbi:MAG: hypothetical protein SWO11_08400 [Thermodesulfobacteriota bacterium]|nr:hypothetical protein [Thermodesulfobacteriota bacterium]